MTELSDYMTTQQAAERLGLTVSLLARRAKKDNWLGAKMIGRQWFFLRSEVERYARAIAGTHKNDPTRGHDL